MKTLLSKARPTGPNLAQPLFSSEVEYGDWNYKVEVFDKSLAVSRKKFWTDVYSKKRWLININVGQVKNLFVEDMHIINCVLIFVFGTEKMAVYKINVWKPHKITRFSIPPLVENRVVYSILSEYSDGNHGNLG